jgi:hypothetical protein
VLRNQGVDRRNSGDINDGDFCPRPYDMVQQVAVSDGVKPCRARERENSPSKLSWPMPCCSGCPITLPCCHRSSPSSHLAAAWQYKSQPILTSRHNVSFAKSRPMALGPRDLLK